MFSLVVIGNSQTFAYKKHLITPRGYLNRKPETGLEIQQASFREIVEQLDTDQYPKDFLWAFFLKLKIKSFFGQFLVDFRIEFIEFCCSVRNILLLFIERNQQFHVQNFSAEIRFVQFNT